MRYWYDKEFECIVCEPNCVDEWLELIWQVGVDYDGCNSVESLKELIDEFIEMSQKARYCLEDGRLFEDKEESKRSREEAVMERKRFENG
jgi:hypothetical protein